MRMGVSGLAVSSTSLLLLVACSGSSSSHTSNATACHAVVADLHKVYAALQTVGSAPKAFPAQAASLENALTADVKNLPAGTLQTAVQDFAAHLGNVAQAISGSKPPSTTDALAFDADGQKISTQCKAAGVSSTG